MKRWKGPRFAAFAVLGLLPALATISAQEPSVRGRDGISPSGVAQPQREAAPREFGTSGATWVRVGPEEFTPNCSGASDFTLWDPQSANYTNRRFVTGSCPFFVSYASHLLAPVRVPGGVIVDTVVLDSCDNDSSGNDVLLDVYDCDHFGACNSSPIASLSSAGNTFTCDFVNVGNLNYRMDNVNRHLLLDVRTQSGLGLTTLTGVLIGYFRQVSPAPATATFADVPTNFIYFRAIEALAASKITSGCGGGNYCPNQAVTRGEMAKFLANALGLYWPN